MKYSLLLAVMAMIITSGCRKDPKPLTIPTLTTATVTNITTTTASSGGTISSNGGAEIIASGICWSKVNATPTIADDTTKGTTTTTGTFVADLKNITPSATYYVRAYATNSVGTAYGNVVTFATGNGVPEARSIIISGNTAVTEKVTARYTYYDFEGNPESGTALQWYIANDTIGAAVTAIAGATDSVYSIVAANQSKFLKVGITPKSSAGNSPGLETRSFWVGPVGAEPTTIAFTYNGTSVTYGIITSSVTGRKWMDRNLGAAHVATSFDTDYQAWGDMFQWGRGADGHQLINYVSASTATAVNGTTGTLSSTDVPGNPLFVLSGGAHDWRSPSNINLWGESGRINNPCPSGWHIPTKNEWLAENITNVTGGNIHTAFNQLKITYTGLRAKSDGTVDIVYNYGQYWTSDTWLGLTGTFENTLAYTIEFGNDNSWGARWQYKANAIACRCIKD